MSLSFARPAALLLLALLPSLLMLFWHARRRRRAMLLRLGRIDALTALSTLQPGRRGRSRALLLGALACLVIAVSGPRWGQGDPGVISGRDLMVVLDLSKSMLADDMHGPDGVREERWQAAQNGIHGLIESIRPRGGHRVGLVMFAGKPWVVCPLTADYDHFLVRLDEFSPKAPPPELNQSKDEEFQSGTRIGVAIVEAVQWQDPRFQGYQDILLISDGDDPAPADNRDREIEAGIRAARDAHVPVYPVGVGDPQNATAVANGDEFRLSRLDEAPLKEIARQTGGEYRLAGQEEPKLAEFFQTSIEPRPTRELPDDALPQPRDRAVWFLLPAIVLLLAAWAVET